ncbi:hypothetical protein J4405_03590 [Candidatus Woesearchaeota archaeon]|nr:hypothetical protein [Candidatus Woesearchaeota archaeon]
MANFYDIFYNLQGSGFYDFFLPFILVFAIVFAVLEKVRLFKRGDQVNTPANLIISIVVGLLLVNQFQIVAALNSFIPRVSFWIIVVVMFLIVIGLFGVGIDKGFSGFMLLLFTIVGVVIIYFSLAPALNFQLPYWIEMNPGWIAMGVIFLIVVFAMSGAFSGSSSNNSMKNLGESLDKMFGRGGGGSLGK